MKCAGWSFDLLKGMQLLRGRMENGKSTDRPRRPQELILQETE